MVNGLPLLLIQLAVLAAVGYLIYKVRERRKPAMAPGIYSTGAALFSLLCWFPCFVPVDHGRFSWPFRRFHAGQLHRYAACYGKAILTYNNHDGCACERSRAEWSAAWGAGRSRARCHRVR